MIQSIVCARCGMGRLRFSVNFTSCSIETTWETLLCLVFRIRDRFISTCSVFVKDSNKLCCIIHLLGKWSFRDVQFPFFGQREWAKIMKSKLLSSTGFFLWPWPTGVSVGEILGGESLKRAQGHKQLWGRCFNCTNSSNKLKQLGFKCADHLWMY